MKRCAPCWEASAVSPASRPRPASVGRTSAWGSATGRQPWSSGATSTSRSREPLRDIRDSRGAARDRRQAPSMARGGSRSPGGMPGRGDVYRGFPEGHHRSRVSRSRTRFAPFMTLSPRQKADCESHDWDFSDLSALFLNCTEHLGYTVPPQADAGWIGEAGPGPSYLDEGSGGPKIEFTQRSTTFMASNLLHAARMLRDQRGIHAHGNQRSAWDAGCRSDHPNPEHR